MTLGELSLGPLARIEGIGDPELRDREDGSASASSSLREGEARAIHRKSEGSAVARSYIARTNETASGVSVPEDLITCDCAASISAPAQ